MTDSPQDSLFLSAFDHAAIGMALVSMEGRWMSVNRSVCKILGYSEAELLELDFQQITHPDDLDLDLTYLEQLIEGTISTYQMDKRYINRHGGIIWVHLTVSAARNKLGTPRFFISQLEDITARKEAERMRDKLFELPLSLHFVAGYDGYFKKLSSGWGELLGFSTAHLKARPLSELLHPEDQERTEREFESISRGERSFLFENRYRCVDGSYRWLLWSCIAEPDQKLIYGVAIDFTARKELELSLRVAVDERERLIKELETSAQQNKQLRDQLVTICAWTNRIHHDGRWMSADEFLGNYLGLHLTHGISEEGKALFLSGDVARSGSAAEADLREEAR